VNNNRIKFHTHDDNLTITVLDR